MFGRRVLLFLLVVFLSVKVRAEVFTVTSNADSGPGTLREALTLAATNGNAVQDVIIFSLQDMTEAGRTITLDTDLPDLSSNLKIDGLTQPGASFGVSGAKVKIVNTFITMPTEVLHVFKGTGVGDFELSGLWLTGTDINYRYTSLINITDSQNIAINNCIIEVGNVSITNCAQATLKSNMSGFKPDGITALRSSFFLTDVVNSIVGGSTPAEGNLVSGGIVVINRTLLTEWTFLINNNKLGSDYTGTSSSPNLFTDLDRIKTTSDNYELDRANLKDMHGVISDNLVVNFGPVGLYISGPGDVSIKRNAIGTDKTGAINFYQFAPDYVHIGSSYAPTAIMLEIGVKATVGGSNGDGNIIGYTSNGILEQLASEVTISENTVFCLETNNYNIHDFIAYPKPLPFVKIDPYTNSLITGTATAGARVELFSNEEGSCTNCGARHFFTSVTANAQGNWAYNGIVPANVVASAIFNNQTSLFTKAQIDLSGLTITQPPCGESTGVITGIKFYNASNVIWVDENGLTVRNTLDIKDLPPGKYKLKIGTGACGVESDWIYIVDNAVKINATAISVKNPSCAQLGSITGVTAATATQHQLEYTWTEKVKGIVLTGSTPDAVGLYEGEYTLTVVDNVTHCQSIYGPVTLINAEAPKIIQTNQSVTPSPCSESTGSITGITATGSGTIKYSWKNETQQEVSTNRDLVSKPPGKYILTITDDSQCGSVSTGLIEIPFVNDITINATNKNIKDATCENFDGSITNLQVTGTHLTYSWKNEQNIEAGTGKDLIGVSAGTYRLTVTGSTYCPSVVSEPFTINSTGGVSLDYSGQGGVSPSCNKTNGSITGLKAPGATTYAWVITGTTTNVGHNLDLTGVAAGLYTLTISNATCSRSYDFEVAGFPPTVFTGITYTKNKTCDGAGNGTITLNTTNANEAPTQYLWLDEQGNPVGYTKEVQFLKAGKYRLQLTNKNFCPVLYPEVFTIEAYPKLEIKSYGTVTNATCGVGTGSITATQFIGGSSNYTYQWYDENNNAIPGKTDAFLNNLVPGKYRLHLEDGTCNPGDVTYTIADEAVTPPPPSADNIQVYNTGAAVIKINNPFPTAIYRLYETATSPQPIKDTIGGNITVNVTESRSYYVSLTYGYCESTRTQVKVFLSALNGNIPNTFTPNNDGINDYWNIPGLDTYPNATVNIFNRYGQAVFQSVGYANPFDGNRNGKPLPTGVYYYIINLKRGDVLSGNVTILR